MRPLSLDKVSALLRYEPDTGRLFWLRRSIGDFNSERDMNAWNARFAEAEAFTSIASTGYRKGAINGRQHNAHRICWLIGTGKEPVGHVDHINGDRSDNRLSNLRDVPASTNHRNRFRPKHNTSGSIGVYWNKAISKWRAQISIRGRRKSLGVFEKMEEAVAARLAANELYGYSERHGEAAKVKL